MGFRMESTKAGMAPSSRWCDLTTRWRLTSEGPKRMLHPSLRTALHRPPSSSRSDRSGTTVGVDPAGPRSTVQCVTDAKFLFVLWLYHYQSSWIFDDADRTPAKRSIAFVPRASVVNTASVSSDASARMLVAHFRNGSASAWSSCGAASKELKSAAHSQPPIPSTPIR